MSLSVTGFQDQGTRVVNVHGDVESESVRGYIARPRLARCCRYPMV